MFINTIKNKIKKIFVYKQFKNNSVFGIGFSITESARCYNEEKNRNNIIIGNNVSILGILMSEDKGTITIGDNTTIRGNTRVVAVDSVEIGNYVIISNNVVIVDNNSHPISVEERKQMSINLPGTELWKSKYSKHSPIVIEDSVWIGERAVILKGVHIGRGSIVACDSVVTKDVPSMSIVAGNPARIVKRLEEEK